MATTAPSSTSSSKALDNGRSWDGEIEPIYDTSLGPMTKRQYFGIKQNTNPKARFDMFLGDKIDCSYPRRTCSCGGEIKVHRGKAVCDNLHCSTIFNDGGKTTETTESGEEESMVITTRIFNDGRKETQKGSIYKPRKTKDGYSHLRKFVSSCKY